MILLPGVVLTNGIKDVLCGDFSAGMAKFCEAMIVITAVGIGIGTSFAPWTVYEQGLTGDEAGLEIGLINACIEGFKAQGVNLDAYNSVENAADVNAVREALGYDQIIYYGASYGSQLGRRAGCDFPDILEGWCWMGPRRWSARAGSEKSGAGLRSGASIIWHRVV